MRLRTSLKTDCCGFRQGIGDWDLAHRLNKLAESVDSRHDERIQQIVSAIRFCKRSNSGIQLAIREGIAKRFGKKPLKLHTPGTTRFPRFLNEKSRAWFRCYQQLHVWLEEHKARMKNEDTDVTRQYVRAKGCRGALDVQLEFVAAMHIREQIVSCSSTCEAMLPRWQKHVALALLHTRLPCQRQQGDLMLRLVSWSLALNDLLAQEIFEHNHGCVQHHHWLVILIGLLRSLQDSATASTQDALGPLSHATSLPDWHLTQHFQALLKPFLFLLQTLQWHRVGMSKLPSSGVRLETMRVRRRDHDSTLVFTRPTASEFSVCRDRWNGVLRLTREFALVVARPLPT